MLLLLRSSDSGSATIRIIGAAVCASLPRSSMQGRGFLSSVRRRLIPRRARQSAARRVPSGTG
jgi:hypothetical protein